MARLVLRGFPPAPELLWCAYCAILAKGALLMPQWEQIEAGLADGKNETFRIGVDPVKIRDLLQEAVTIAPVPQLGPAPVPVCWLHLPAIDGNAPMPEVPEQQRPGLIVPGNDQRRRGQS